MADAGWAGRGDVLDELLSPAISSDELRTGWI
jgi:hypothetical protein